MKIASHSAIAIHLIQTLYETDKEKKFLLNDKFKDNKHQWNNKEPTSYFSQLPYQEDISNST